MVSCFFTFLSMHFGGMRYTLIEINFFLFHLFYYSACFVLLPLQEWEKSFFFSLRLLCFERWSPQKKNTSFDMKLVFGFHHKIVRKKLAVIFLVSRYSSVRVMWSLLMLSLWQHYQFLKDFQGLFWNFYSQPPIG